MNDFLEKLEIGENKIKLSQEEIKSILSEHGKSIKVETEKVKNNMQKENDDLKKTIEDLKIQIDNAPKTSDLENLKSKIAEYETKEKERKEEEDKKNLEETLNKNVLEAIGDKDFVNERTKNAIINEIKTALQDKANVGKSAKDIFEDITKDSTDIFKNQNEMKDMSDIKDDVSTGKSKNDGIKINPMFKTEF